MNLTDGGRRKGSLIKSLKEKLGRGAELTFDLIADNAEIDGRCFSLKRGESLGHLWWQQLGADGSHLPHLHDGAFELTERFSDASTCFCSRLLPGFFR